MQYITKTLSLLFSFVLLAGCTLHSENKSNKRENTADTLAITVATVVSVAESDATAKAEFVDTAEYDKMMMHMVNGDTTGLWRVANDV